MRNCLATDHIEYSMRLNRKWRLILELRKKNDVTVVFIAGIEDYH